MVGPRAALAQTSGGAAVSIERRDELEGYVETMDPEQVDTERVDAFGS